MHSIRLRGPWQLEPLARFIRQADGAFQAATDDLPPSARETMPADWSASLGSDFLGRVRYHRVFQKPTGLDAGEHVFLVVEPPRSRGLVRLADCDVGEARVGHAPARFDITDRLQERNRLEIIVEHPASRDGVCDNALPGGLVGEVRLEIEEG
jgi:hypothetical protein